MENGSGGPVPGVIAGIVSDLGDPENLGRVKVTFPDLGGVSSDWARIIAPSAGSGRGALFRPESGDEVMVSFERGDLRSPYVLGGVWSQADPPPPGDGDQRANNLRSITSRSGHAITFDDTPGGEKLEITDRDGRHVTLDSAGKKITVRAPSGDVEVQADTGNVRLIGQQVFVTATQELHLHSDGIVKITGRSIDLN